MDITLLDTIPTALLRNELKPSSKIRDLGTPQAWSEIANTTQTKRVVLVRLKAWAIPSELMA
jgi:hypothetical protein